MYKSKQESKTHSKNYWKRFLNQHLPPAPWLTSPVPWGNLWLPDVQRSRRQTKSSAERSRSVGWCHINRFTGFAASYMLKGGLWSPIEAYTLNIISSTAGGQKYRKKKTYRTYRNEALVVWCDASLWRAVQCFDPPRENWLTNWLTDWLTN